jgi:hypothetical protein
VFVENDARNIDQIEESLFEDMRTPEKRKAPQVADQLFNERRRKSFLEQSTSAEVKNGFIPD